MQYTSYSPKDISGGLNTRPHEQYNIRLNRPHLGSVGYDGPVSMFVVLVINHESQYIILQMAN